MILRMKGLFIRKAFMTLALLFSAAVAFAGNLDEMFEKALQRGRKEDMSYVIEKSDGKPVKLNKMEDFILAKKGYRILNKTSDKRGYLETLTFIDKPSYYFYVFYTICEDKQAALAAESGRYLGLVGTRFRGDYKTFNTELSGKRYYVDKWSGTVENGYIHGSGIGVATSSDGGTVFILIGTYDHGIPVSDIFNIWYKGEDLEEFQKPDYGKLSKQKFDALPAKGINEGFRKYGEKFPQAFVGYYASKSDLNLDDYLKEVTSYFRQVPFSVSPPRLSQNILSRTGFAEYVFFYADRKAFYDRMYVKSLASTGDEKAIEALDYMDVMDGYYLTVCDNRDWAKKVLEEKMLASHFSQSNYWYTLTLAEQKAKRLKKEKDSLGGQFNLVETSIRDWHTKMSEANENAKIAMRKAFGAFLESALSSDYSGSSNNAASSSVKSCRVHLYFKDGSVVSNETIATGCSSFSSNAAEIRNFETDGSGYVTIRWKEGEIAPDWIRVKNAPLSHMGYLIKKLELEDGGSYEICVDVQGE